jgi:hypothetical protein
MVVSSRSLTRRKAMMIGLLVAVAIAALWVGVQWVMNDVRARLATVRAVELCNELSLQHRDCSHWSSLPEGQRSDPWDRPMSCLPLGTSFAVVTFGADRAAGGTEFAYDQYCSPSGHSLGKRCTCRFESPLPALVP